MALTYVKDIPDFDKKVKDLTNITEIQEGIIEIQEDITKLSANMSEAQEDISTLAGAVTALDEEIDGKKISFTEIFYKVDLPITETSYDCNWSNYDALSLEIVFYGNTKVQMLIPTTYFNNTSLGQRPQIYEPANQYSIDVYKNTDNKIYVKASTSISTLGLRIYGIKLG